MLYSIKIANFNYLNLLYVYIDYYVYIFLFSNDYIIDVSNSYFDYYSKYKNATFEISSKMQGDIETKTNITVHGVKSGLIINNIVQEISVSVLEDQDSVEINLDDYFTGYRRNISVAHPFNDKFEISSLANFQDQKFKRERFEFLSIQDEDHYEVKLIYIGNDVYLYIDEFEFIYLEIVDNGIVNVIYITCHFLPEVVRDAKYIPDYFINGNQSKSNGTVIAISTVDGVNEAISFCTV